MGTNLVHNNAQSLCRTSGGTDTRFRSRRLVPEAGVRLV